MTDGNRPDLVLMHPPAVFDFRERELNHWMLSKAVDTKPVFEYYPVGFITILDDLEERGRSVRLANMAVKMQARRFDPRRFVREHEPLLFGIDLHWAQHADGALSLAKLCKEEHPDIPVALGGLSATYFWKELCRNPDVDFILRGETTEEPLAQLLDCLEAKQEPVEVPNLIWRRNGEVVENPFTHRPTLLTTRINYERLFRHWRRTRDLKGSLITGQHWPVYCANLLLFCKGCVENCAICGGSNRALGLEETPLWDIQVLADMCVAARQLTKFPIRLPGDIRQGDWRGFLAALKERNFTRAMHFDIFRPGDAEFYQAVAEAVPEPQGTIGPVTHDEKLRARYGWPYDNSTLERSIEDFLGVGGKLDLFFYIGIPGQSEESAKETTDYALALLDRFSGGRREKRFDVYVSALAPFVDPGSLAFSYPEKYGYRLRARTLADHRALMRQPEWWDSLNYESEAMSRFGLAQASLEAEARVTRARADLGLYPRRHAGRDLKRLEEEAARLEDSMLAGTADERR
ncbi:MAG: cobalamin-dependent protein [Armatimonadota bacterium]|nr:MAG: cobalamin-dependent protein [Armatimonadota bacterium]